MPHSPTGRENRLMRIGPLRTLARRAPGLGWMRGFVGYEFRCGLPLQIGLGALMVAFVLTLPMFRPLIFRGASTFPLAILAYRIWQVSLLAVSLVLAVVCATHENEEDTLNESRTLPLAELGILQAKIAGAILGVVAYGLWSRLLLAAILKWRHWLFPEAGPPAMLWWFWGACGFFLVALVVGLFLKRALVSLLVSVAVIVILAGIVFIGEKQMRPVRLSLVFVGLWIFGVYAIETSARKGKRLRGRLIAPAQSLLRASVFSNDLRLLVWSTLAAIAVVALGCAFWRITEFVSISPYTAPVACYLTACVAFGTALFSARDGERRGALVHLLPVSALRLTREKAAVFLVFWVVVSSAFWVGMETWVFHGLDRAIGVCMRDQIDVVNAPAGIKTAAMTGILAHPDVSEILHWKTWPVSVQQTPTPFVWALAGLISGLAAACISLTIRSRIIAFIASVVLVALPLFVLLQMHPLAYWPLLRSRFPVSQYNADVILSHNLAMDAGRWPAIWFRVALLVVALVPYGWMRWLLHRFPFQDARAPLRLVGVAALPVLIGCTFILATWVNWRQAAFLIIGV